MGAERVLQYHIRDITDRKRTEAALRENVEQTDVILNSALDAVIAMSAEGLITVWNTQAERVLAGPGRSPLEGRSPPR